MAEECELEEVEVVEVLVYDKEPSEMVSGVAEIGALDDLYIHVWLDDETIQQFPNHHVKLCGDA